MYVIVEDPKEDIFKTNPQLELISEFADLINDLGREKASTILTAIYLIYDPKSQLKDSGMTEEEVILDVNKNLLDDPSFDWSQYEDLIETYKTKNVSKTEKLLLEYETQMEEMDKFLASWTWEASTAKDKTVVLANKRKLWDDYLDVRAKVLDERRDAEVESRGGYTKSFIEDYV